MGKLKVKLGKWITDFADLADFADSAI